MNHLVKLSVVGISVIGVGLLGLAGCVSTVAPRSDRQSDSEITAVIQASLEASDEVRAMQVEVETRGGVVYLAGVVDTEAARREAGRLAWSTEGVGGVMNELSVGRIES